MAAEIMDVEGLAAYLRIPKWSVYRLAAAGRLPGAKVGRHWRFHKGLVDEWLIANGRRNLAGAVALRGARDEVDRKR